MYLSELYNNLEKYSSLSEKKVFVINDVRIEKFFNDYKNRNVYHFLHSSLNSYELKYDMVWEITTKNHFSLIEINDELPNLIRQEKIKKILQ